VLPEPWRPTIIIVVTPPLGLNFSDVSTGPMRASSSSWQTLMKWSPAEILCFRPCLSVMVVWTVEPTAFSRTRATKDFTTSKATSASRSETRMSRSDSSTSSGVISCFPARRFLAARKPLVTVSSMGGNVFNTGPGHVGPPSRFLACLPPEQVTSGLHLSEGLHAEGAVPGWDAVARAARAGCRGWRAGRSRSLPGGSQRRNHQHPPADQRRGLCPRASLSRAQRRLEHLSQVRLGPDPELGWSEERHYRREPEQVRRLGGGAPDLPAPWNVLPRGGGRTADHRTVGER